MQFQRFIDAREYSSDNKKERKIPEASSFLPPSPSLCDTNWAILFSRRTGKAKVAEKEGWNAGSLKAKGIITMAKRKLNRPSTRRQIGGKRILKNGEGGEGCRTWSKKGTRRSLEGWIRLARLKNDSRYRSIDSKWRHLGCASCGISRWGWPNRTNSGQTWRACEIINI